MDERCRQEIVELHEFFAGWLTGRISAADETLERVGGVLHPDFEIITPSAQVIDRGNLLESLKKAHGARESQAGFAIRVDGFCGWRLGGGFHLGRYREWQMEEDGFKGRLSSVLFRERPDAPNGVEWLHVHEVWLL